MKYLAISVLFATSACLAQAQTFSPIRIADFPRFRLIRGNVNSNGSPISGAKLCLLLPTDVCYKMPSNTGYSGSVMYDYGLAPRSERVSLKEGGSLVFFSAQFSGGGSGTFDSLAILRYESGKIVNLLPFVGVTNQSERAMWSIPEASNLPVLVTADFDWADGETHFAKHFYTVTAYRFDAKSGRYAKAVSYRTSKMYPGLDDVDQIRVLKPEREEILRRLGKI